MAVDAKGLWFEIRAGFQDQVSPGVQKAAANVDQQANRMQQAMNKVGAQGPGAGLTAYMGAIGGVARNAQMAAGMLPGFGQAASSAAGTVGNMAASVMMAKDGFAQISLAAKSAGISLVGLSVGAGLVGAALAYLAYEQNKATEALERAKKELSRKEFTESAAGAADLYRWNKQLAESYDALSKKVNRTAQEEQMLQELREKMTRDVRTKSISGFNLGTGAGSVASDAGRFSSVLGTGRNELTARLVELQRALFEARDSYQKVKSDATRMRIADLEEAVRVTKAALQEEEKKKKMTEAELQALQAKKALLAEIEDELDAVSAATWKIYEASQATTDITGIGAASLVNGPLGRDFAAIQDANRRAMEQQAREQAAASRAAYDAIGIDAEQQRVTLEADFQLSPEALDSQRAYIDMMEEIRYLEAELAQLSPEEAAAQRENYYNRMAIASQKYQTTLKRLEHEQSVVRNVTANLTKAFQSAYVAAVLGQQSFAQAFRMAAAEYIAGESSKAMIGAIMETAHGFAALASHRYADAAFHFKAAAFYAAVGAVAGMAARAIAGGGAGGGSGDGGERGEETGPREYSTEDLRRIRSQSGGESGSTGGGESSLGKSAPVVNVTFKVQAIDAAGVSKLFQRQGGALARSVADALVKNGSTAKRLGGLATREL